MLNDATSLALAKVESFAGAERLFRRVSAVAVAVSGGADSVACLHLLKALAPKIGLSLTVVHFDHMLRPDSKDDLQAVRELAARLELPFLSGEGEVRRAAAERRMGLEEAARTMRYQFLSFVAAEKRLDAIITGHTHDDHIETILMRVIRGSGIRGLRGILPSTNVPGGGAQRLLRPILCLTRAETEAVCAAVGTTPRDDPSNRDARFVRNRVRHEVLPLLRDLSPGVDRSLAGLAQSAAEAFAPVERAAMAVAALRREVTGAVYDAAAFVALPAEARTLVIEREASFSKLTPDVNRSKLANLDRALRAGSGSVLFGEAAVQISCGQVRIGPPLEAEPFEGRILNVPGVTLAGRWRVTVTTDRLADAGGGQDGLIDLATLSGALRARALQPGDRIVARGLDRTLADYLASRRFPIWERQAAVAIADARRVRLVFLPSGVVSADVPEGADPWSVRIAPAAAPTRAPAGSPLR